MTTGRYQRALYQQPTNSGSRKTPISVIAPTKAKGLLSVLAKAASMTEMRAHSRLCRDARPRLMRGRTFSNLRMLRQFQRILDVHAQMPNSIFDLGAPA